MRLSAAHLVDTAVRLADLRFPATTVHVHRTRLAYIHLEHLLHFAKIDRDGRIDGFIAAYLPNEVALLFLEQGEVVTAAAMAESGREVLPIATALGRIEDELERGELAFCEAPLQQLVWMYSSCAGPLTQRPVIQREPWLLFEALKHERYSGILELISDGRVTYLHFSDGRYQSGQFCDKDEAVTVSDFVKGLLASGPEGSVPNIVAAVFDAQDVLPKQAPPPMIATYHTLFWRIADAAEGQVAGEGLRRAVTVRDTVRNIHPSVRAIGGDRDSEPEAVVVTPDALTLGLSDWVGQLLEQLEVIAPGVATEILREATREHRFVLQKAGFYDRLPWSVTW